ncbi:hypothetical protein ACLQ2N_32870 [Streptomyces sp. DT224]|uniref:hypothetical protein n=1 Tax=Streptomyces sp. DT224 TaxID=3393426 RepID=UPI003CE98C28
MSHRSVSRGTLLLPISAALLTFGLLFSVALLNGDDDPPTCPASRSGVVDIVSSGPRPCILRGGAAAVAPGAGSGAGQATVPGTARKTTGQGKGPTGAAKPQRKAPAVKAPAVKVPAVKVPAKRR